MPNTLASRVSCIAFAILLTACGSGGSSGSKGTDNAKAAPTKAVVDEFAPFCDPFDVKKIEALSGGTFDKKTYAVSGRGTASCSFGTTATKAVPGLRVGITRQASDADRPRLEKLYGGASFLKPQSVKGVGDRAMVILREFTKGSASAELTFDVGDDRWFVYESSSAKLSKADAQAGAEAVAKYVIPLIGDAMTFTKAKILASKDNPANFIKVSDTDVSAATGRKLTKAGDNVYWSENFGSMGWVDKQKSQPVSVSYSNSRDIDEARTAAGKPGYEGKKSKITAVAGLGDKAFVASNSYGTGAVKSTSYSVYFQDGDNLWTVYVNATGKATSDKGAIALATALKESL